MGYVKYRCVYIYNFTHFPALSLRVVPSLLCTPWLIMSRGSLLLPVCMVRATCLSLLMPTRPPWQRCRRTQLWQLLHTEVMLATCPKPSLLPPSKCLSMTCTRPTETRFAPFTQNTARYLLTDLRIKDLY